MTKQREPLRIAVFASGRGSNFEAILKNIKNGTVNAKVVAVISNKSSAGVLETARKENIPSFHLSDVHFNSLEEYTERLLQVLAEAKTELVVLAGYMKMVPPAIVRHYKYRMLNIHPALLPSFGGKGLYGHFVHEAVLEYGCKVSGVTVHMVDEEYDTGPPVMQKCVPVMEYDTPDTLAARVLVAEHEIYSTAIQLFAQDRIEIKGRKVVIKKWP
ncbi:phosphoribosylglycinamide formyltransferase [candidate division KSB1 bacterium]|nr:phosphoribosylglycinamide formyltransferase [candidate division KSB1 bacterium]